MSLLATILNMVRKLGPKLEQCWPYLLQIYNALLAIYAVINDGQPLSLARGGGEIVVTTAEGRELVNLLSSADPKRSHQAKELAALLENVDSRLSR